MVRLKLFKQQYFKVKDELSQFHYGSIKTEEAERNGTSYQPVSIPLWFD